MKFSLNWIIDYIKLDLSIEEIVEKLSEIGLLVESITPRGRDYLLDIEIFSNRPDCMNVLGICRELAVAIGAEVNYPSLTYKEIEENISKYGSVEILDPDLCPRYCAKLIKNVVVAPSPDWLVERLISIGLHPINNVVDITNFVLWEMGHPLHAFDFNNITDSKIIVRRSKNGEKITTIDEVERELDENVLVIADANKPVAIGGVMGGINSYITEQTSDILLEAAYFNPASIRKTAKKFSLDTDASHRFERGSDHEALARALDRTCHLLQQIAGGEIYQGIIDVYPKKIAQKKTNLRVERAEKLLGIELKNEVIEKTLKQLEFTVERSNKNEYGVTIPTFRIDVTQEIDLIEEIARFYGYHNIPSSLPPLIDVEIKDSTKLKIRDLIRSILCNSGFTEAVNYSFLEEDKNFLFDERDDKKVLQLKNPITDTMNILRTSLLPSLINNVAQNINYGISDIRLFEMGKCYFPVKPDSLPLERESFGIVATGRVGMDFWKGDHRQIDFYDLKGVIEFLFETLNLKGQKFNSKPIKYLHPGQSAVIIFNEDEIGSIGLLHPEIAQVFHIKDSVYLAHIFIDTLLDTELVKVTYQEPTKYPGIRRDISLICDEALPFSNIKDIIDSLSEEIISDVKVIETYKGANVPESKKSLLISIYYQHLDRTLKAEEVSQVHEQVINQLKSNLKIELR